MTVRANVGMSVDSQSRPAGQGELRAHVVDATGSVAAVVSWLEEQLGRVGALTGASGEIRVRLVGDAEMSQAHEEFAGVEGTTDVLTFDLTDPEENPNDGPVVVLRSGRIEVLAPRVVDADVLACVDEATRQAAARGHRVDHELLLYGVHALLHCLGHDDHGADQFRAMHELEDAILTELGLGRVYSQPGEGGAS